VGPVNLGNLPRMRQHKLLLLAFFLGRQPQQKYAFAPTTRTWSVAIHHVLPVQPCDRPPCAAVLAVAGHVTPHPRPPPPVLPFPPSPLPLASSPPSCSISSIYTPSPSCASPSGCSPFCSAPPPPLTPLITTCICIRCTGLHFYCSRTATSHGQTHCTFEY
jgi:hypothetical protein